MATRLIRKMALTLLAAALMVICGTSTQKAFGQEPNAPPEKKAEKPAKGDHRIIGERVRQRMAELNEKLNLTDEQKKSIHPIIENEVKEIQSVRSDTSLSKEQRMEKMTEIRQKSREEIRKLLTPDQQAKWAEAKEQMKETMKERPKEPMKEGGKADSAERIQRRMMELNAKLALTDDQKKQIQPIIENEMKEMTALKTDTTLTKEQRQEKSNAIHQASHDEIRKVLTADQQAKFDAMKGKPEKKMEQKGKGQQ